MSNDLRVTQVDTSYLDPATRDAARRYLERSGNADITVILGLTPDPGRKRRPPKGTVAPVRECGNGYEVRDGKHYCTQCRRRTQADGRCRRSDCGGAR